VLATAGIKWGTTIRTSVAACHVLLDGHFISASAAEHRRLSPFHLRPDLDRMARQSLVTLLAGEIYTAAVHLDRDNIENGSVVGAASLCIQIDSSNFGARGLQRSIDYLNKSERSVTGLRAQNPAVCPALPQLRQGCTDRANCRLQLPGLRGRHRDRRGAIPRGSPYTTTPISRQTAARSPIVRVWQRWDLAVSSPPEDAAFVVREHTGWSPIRRPYTSEKMAEHPCRVDHRRPNLILQKSRCILPLDG
jgi:hypothetical protein